MSGNGTGFETESVLENTYSFQKIKLDKKKLDWKLRFKNVIKTGILGGVMVTCAVSCITFMPLGDAMTLLFTSPLTTMIIAAIFLGKNL